MKHQNQSFKNAGAYCKKIAQNIAKDTLLSSLLGLSFVFFFGAITVTSPAFEASLLSSKTISTEQAIADIETRLPLIFTDLSHFKEVSITSLSKTSFLVEFLATSSESSDVLHPYSYIIFDDNGTLIGIRELNLGHVIPEVPLQ